MKFKSIRKNENVINAIFEIKYNIVLKDWMKIIILHFF